MATASVESDDILCVSLKRKSSDEYFHLNFVSDSSESSMRLPDFMIYLSQQPEGSISEGEQLEIIAMNKEQIKDAVEVSMDALYGNKMPRVYRGQDGRDLVMNVYIFEDHSEVLRILPRKGFLMTIFTSLTFLKCHQRIQEVIGGQQLTIPELKGLQMANKCKPTGRKAKRDEISSFLRGSVCTAFVDVSQLSLISPKTIKQNSPLLCIGFIDRQSRRGFYINIIANDKPGSIKLPKQMIRLAKMGRLEARREAEDLMRRKQNQETIFQHTTDCLENLYKLEGPVVFVAKNNEANLVVNVPVHIDHARLFPKCLLGFYKTAFYGALTTYYRECFLKESQRNDLERNKYIELVFGQSQNEAIGRLATKEEIYSLVLKEKTFTPGCSII